MRTNIILVKIFRIYIYKLQTERYAKFNYIKILAQYNNNNNININLINSLLIFYNYNKIAQTQKMEQILSQKTIKKISSQILQRKSKKVVLQFPKYLLSHSFTLTAQLHKLHPQTQFYTLYDSNKKQCCTDIIGAKHINYDLLFHFGYACFSQKYQAHHIYILPTIEQSLWDQNILPCLMRKNIINSLIKNDIRLIICDQSLYHYVMNIKQFIQNIQSANNYQNQCAKESQEKQIDNKINNETVNKQKHKIQIARLPFDKKQDDKYFGFSYYWANQNKEQEEINILVIKPELQQNLKINSNPTSQLLLQNLMLCKKSLKINKIFTLTPKLSLQKQNKQINEQIQIQQYTKQQSKRLMQRISQISQLQKYETFGILISNPSTIFCQQKLTHLQKLLSNSERNIKYFTFMMNNLNQCKLGNFPQIQVYIIVSCYNYSLYSVKDFYRLVVTPFDIQVAFGNANYEKYQFDLSLENNKHENQKQVQQSQQTKYKQEKYNQSMQSKQEKGNQNKDEAQIKTENSIIKQNGQILLQTAIQTLDYYKNREYKGLQFADKKQIDKIKLGKIGTATGYRPL